MPIFLIHVTGKRNPDSPDTEFLYVLEAKDDSDALNRAASHLGIKSLYSVTDVRTERA